VTPTLNGHVETKPPAAATAQDVLAGLAARLTDPDDREAYAALISYFDSLPPGDDLAQIAKLLGFLTLLGQHIPDAMAEFLETFRQERKVPGSAADYAGIGSTVSAELAKLTIATRELQRHNAARDGRQRREWVLEILFGSVLVLLGVLAGVWWEKGQTLDAIRGIAAQIEHVQPPGAAPEVPASAPHPKHKAVAR
jgi:hypothetical protein